MRRAARSGRAFFTLSAADGRDGRVLSNHSPGKPGCVEEGYKGRGRRGVTKAGGYDETTNRRGARKVRGARIRYVEEDERGGGTTEQGIRTWDQ